MSEQKQYGWRDAIGVLKDAFPEGMLSEDIIWCQYAGMSHDEFMQLKNAGTNPRDFDTAIAAYTTHLWQRADAPATVEAVAKAVGHDARLHPQSYTTEMSARCSIAATLTALLGPRPTEQGNANER